MLRVMIGSVNTADTIQEMIPKVTRSVQQSRNEEPVTASSEQPDVAKPEGTTCKEIKYIRIYLIILYYSLVFPRDLLYTGMMHHEEKKNTHWKTMYSVVRDLNVLKKVYIILDIICLYGDNVYSI